MLDNKDLKEIPLLNRLKLEGKEYQSMANRTYEDDNAVVFDIGNSIKKRTHINNELFEHIFNSTMRFFTEQEKYAFRQYQTNEKPKEEFYRDCANYLKRSFPNEMNNENDFNAMMDRIDLAMFKYDVIQPLIDNEDTTDIKICSPKDIRVRIKGKAYKSSATFASDRDLNRFIEGLSYRNNVDILNSTILTFTDDHDPNYILRFTVSSPLVTSVGYPYLHIRKVNKTKADFDELIRRDMLNPDIKTYLIDKAKTSKGIIFAGPPGCVDNETEFFNGYEWKSIADYNIDDKVLQFNPETNEANLVYPLRYIKEPCDKMYHFETKYGINQTISPDHRVLYYNKTHKNGKKIWSDKFKEMSGEDLFNLQNKGKFKGGFKTDFIYNGKGLNLSDIEIKLMLAVICDGTFKKDCKTNWCSIKVKKQRKKDELKKILTEWGKEYIEKDYSNGYTRFSFNAPRKEKIFTSDWYTCTQKQLQIICDNILKWDGYIKNKTKTFSTKEKSSADFIQFAFSSCGYRATISIDDRRNQNYITNGKEYKRTNLYYHLTISNNTIVGMAWHNDGRTNNTKLEEVVPPDGYKYCFTVPTHALVLRRNGRIFITKNCGKTTILNAFIEYIPRTRETLVIQENDELFTEQSGFMFKHVTHGFHGEPVVTLEDLGKMALVEGCNEFIIGEVKGGEMRSAMTLINAGGYAALTVHSTNAYETLDKCADLVKYGSDYSFQEARRMLKTFDTVVYMENYKVREILEVNGYNDETNQYNYNCVYKYGL